MRIADIALGIPLLPFVIVLAAFLGPSTWNVVLAMSLLLWPNSARIIRAQVLSLRERAYVEAARTAGSSHLRILIHHIAPNILPLALLFGSIAVGWAILTEASVSFLGFADPDTTTWGFMLQDAYVSQALSRGLYNWFVPPGICIVLLVSAGFFISRSYEQFLFPAIAGLKAMPDLVATQTIRHHTGTTCLLCCRCVICVSPTGPVHAVDGASFDVGQAEMIGLVGESGCGKTTAARALTGVMAGNARVTGGTVTFTGRDLLALNHSEMRAVRWKEIAFVPQSAMNSLDPVYRVERQLQEVLRRGPLRGHAARQRAIVLLDMVGLTPDVLNAFPHQLSGGMRQRVAIALALALNPLLVIADEPVTALDVIVQREVLDTLRDLQKRLRLSVIMITHDISVVAYCCDSIVVMYAGQVVESGPSAVMLGFAAHPYTMGLCNAFPDLQRAADLLVPIEGSPPDLRYPPSGCRFAPRCPFAIAHCALKPPPLIEIAPNHKAACWRANEAGTIRQRAAEAATWIR